MPRSVFATRRATHGVHRFRNIRLRFMGQYTTGFHVLHTLRGYGMKDRDILPLLERLERQENRRTLLAMPCPTNRTQ